MGADAPGKQELAVDLVEAGRLYADVPQQSNTIGEFQWAYREGKIKDQDIASIGAVINGGQKGRQSGQEITIFDSSGTALQDLAIGGLALELAIEHRLATALDLLSSICAPTTGPPGRRNK
jgi:alanine dehydrogenase